MKNLFLWLLLALPLGAAELGFVPYNTTNKTVVSGLAYPGGTFVGDGSGLTVVPLPGPQLYRWPTQPGASAAETNTWAFGAQFDGEFATYAQYTNLWAGLLAYSNTTMTALGLDASGALPVYLFASTPTGYEQTVMLVSGQHGWERSGPMAAWRLMYSVLSDSNSPRLQYLKQRVRWLVIGSANPYGFANGTYHNANDVNLNRNYPYRWEYETNANKGASALSEPESQYVNQVLTNERPTVVLDLHNGNGFSEAFWFAPPDTNLWLDTSYVRAVTNFLAQPGDLLYTDLWPTTNWPPQLHNWAALNGSTAAGLEIFKNTNSPSGSGTNLLSSAAMTSYVNWIGNVTLGMLQTAPLKTIVNPLRLFDDRVTVAANGILLNATNASLLQGVMFTTASDPVVKGIYADSTNLALRVAGVNVVTVSPTTTAFEGGISAEYNQHTPARFIRRATANGAYGALLVGITNTSAAGAAGLGPVIYFQSEGPGSQPNHVGAVGAVIYGATSNSMLFFSPSIAGEDPASRRDFTLRATSGVRADAGLSGTLWATNGVAVPILTNAPNVVGNFTVLWASNSVRPSLYRTGTNGTFTDDVSLLSSLTLTGTVTASNVVSAGFLLSSNAVPTAAAIGANTIWTGNYTNALWRISVGPTTNALWTNIVSGP